MTLWIYLLGLCLSSAFQPKLIQDAPDSYLPGDKIDHEMFVIDSSMKERSLVDLINPGTDVVVLVLFGGAALEIPDGDFRGSLWCEDSFDDLAIQRALVAEFVSEPVQFIPVAFPPVFSTERYGFSEDVFFMRSNNDRSFRKVLRRFIKKTNQLAKKSLLPFETVYFDPKVRLTQDRDSAELTEKYGPIYEWQGKLKWYLDPRTYGAPTIWILDGEGRVLQEPFWGNDYDSEPPQINYGFAELKGAVNDALAVQP